MRTLSQSFRDFTKPSSMAILSANFSIVIFILKYTKLGIESWVSNWKRNNWKTSKGQPVLNKDLWIALHTTEQALKREGIRTKIFWVKGHSGIPGNEAADRLAVAGINRG